MSRIFCVLLFSFLCLQGCFIGRAHPCNQDIPCDGDDVCYKNWCFPKDWSGFSKEVFKGSEDAGGHEPTPNDFQFPEGENFQEEKQAELESGLEFPSNEIQDESTQEKDCSNLCQRNAERPCFPKDKKGCDAQGNCQGTCQMGKQSCQEEKGCLVWTTCKGFIIPQNETCDNKDNDCNGKTDETLSQKCYEGSSGKGNGICKAGEQICEKGVWGACKGQILPEKEECDQVDNDCDGKIDEDCDCVNESTQVCYTKSEGCKKIGNAFQCQAPCKVGKQTCEKGRWGSCKEEKGPEKETCDNVDNDCNGKVDDQLQRSCYQGPPTSKNVGICKPGIETCSSGGWGTCVGQVLPSIEICDGKDNDCNGQSDEAFSGKGSACNSGQKGICSEGIWKCTNQKKTCAPINTPQKEVCNNKDDNCNGTTDEGLTRACYRGSSTTNGVGLCKPGVETCKAGGWGSCVGDILPTIEVCDGKDNDCNGKIDETFSNKGAACNSEKKGICKPGVWQCINKKKTCVPNQQPQQEACNGKDNNCDGTVDDGCVTTFMKNKYTIYSSGFISFDSNQNIYVSEGFNHKITKINPNQAISTFAGSGQIGYKDGKGTLASFSFPGGLQFYQSFLYVADLGHKIRKIDTQGNVTTLTGSNQQGYKEGTVSNALFYEPASLTFDPKGNLYIVDSGNFCVRKIDTKGNVTTLAGSGSSGNKNGNGKRAEFGKLIDIKIDSKGNLYVSDSTYHLIKKIDPTGNVTTFAGSGKAGDKDGLGVNAEFNTPHGVAIDSKDNLYITDSKNNKIKKINSKGKVSAFAGTGQDGFQDGLKMQSTFSRPSGLQFSPEGHLYVVDVGNHHIRIIKLTQ